MDNLLLESRLTKRDAYNSSLGTLIRGVIDLREAIHLLLNL